MDAHNPPVPQAIPLSLPPLPKLSDLTREFWEKLLSSGIGQRDSDDIQVGTKPWM